MNTLLIFFALPIATIILAIVLQTVLRRPILVALTFFAIYLVVTFAAFDASFLVFAIAYTILAYIAAVITRFIINAMQCEENVEEAFTNASNTINNNTFSNNIPNLVNAINAVNSANTSNSNNLISSTNSTNCGCRCRRNNFSR